jgi:hypothetical protein
MPTVAELQTVKAQAVTVTDELLIVELADGRTLSVPLSWYPRLWHGGPKERQNWRLIGQWKAFTGPILTKMSASKICCWADLRAKARLH